MTRAEAEALAFIEEYRDALREYHKDNPTVLARIDLWTMTYGNGWFYIQGQATRRKEIERRIDFMRAKP